MCSVLAVRSCEVESSIVTAVFFFFIEVVRSVATAGSFVFSLEVVGSNLFFDSALVCIVSLGSAATVESMFEVVGLIVAV